MKFTLYACTMPTHTEYEYTWGKRIGNFSDTNFTCLIRDIVTATDLIYDDATTLVEYYADRNAVIIPLWSKSYPSLKRMQSSIIADITAEHPELLI